MRWPPIALGLCVAALARGAWGEGPRMAKLLRGPYLTGLTDTGVDVRMELTAPSFVRVEVRRDGAEAGGPAAFEDAAGVMHIVHATGLEAATGYTYAVRVGGKVVGEGRFVTAPKPDSGAPLRFLVYGDTRTDTVAHAGIVRALAAASADFLIATGDMVADGGRADEWQSFFDIEARLLRERPIFVTVGNHELYDDRAGANFARYFGFADSEGQPQPYGTVRLSNVRFFFLNSMHDWNSGTDRQWLERELSRSDSEPGLVWRIAVMHQGPWSGGPHGGSAVLIRARVPELFAAHHVDLLFSGHDHIYERGESGTVKYVISGGGGSPLYGVSNVATTRKAEAAYHYVQVDTGAQEIRVVARRIDGSVLDQCGFTKNSRWDCDVPSAAPPPPTPASSTGTPAPRCGCAIPGMRMRERARESGQDRARTAGELILSIVVAALPVWRRGRRLDRAGRRPVGS